MSFHALPKLPNNYSSRRLFQTVYVTDMSSKRTRNDLTLKQKFDIINCVEGGGKHFAVAIAYCVSRSTVAKIVQNKKTLLDAFIVR